jgi:transposase IS200-family protein
MENNTDIRRGRHAVWDLHVHLVFITKYRRNVFTHDMLTACENIMREVCESFGATLDEFNGETDHVHLLVRYPATVTVSKLVNSLKGVSSRCSGVNLKLRLPRFCGVGICGHGLIMPVLLVVPH